MIKDQEKLASWLKKQDEELRKVTTYGKIVLSPYWTVHKFFLNGEPVSEELKNKLFNSTKHLIKSGFSTRPAPKLSNPKPLKTFEL